ncbi:MAG: PHP domain-containing protein [Chloroflexi bacterium]|nr:PHP domain-containing protein [Chloroflexota bacterium]
MGALFDLHVHTVKGSGDSSLLPAELLVEAKRRGLRGVCLTEHSGWRDAEGLRRFAAQADLIVVPALEIETAMGHILVFGIKGYPEGAADVRRLRKVVSKAGGYMVAAHPFRNLFNPPPYNRSLLYPSPDGYPATPQEAATHPLFELVDALEVVNGANTGQENLFALEVAGLLDKGAVGGSDAHSRSGVGAGHTLFDGDVRNVQDFLEALHAGAFRPRVGTGLPLLADLGAVAAAIEGKNGVSRQAYDHSGAMPAPSTLKGRAPDHLPPWR